ncbi:hypothetical protein T31B1_14204 [Salinisphaera sp. T31B1]
MIAGPLPAFEAGHDRVDESSPAQKVRVLRSQMRAGAKSGRGASAASARSTDARDRASVNDARPSPRFVAVYNC